MEYAPSVLGGEVRRDQQYSGWPAWALWKYRADGMETVFCRTATGAMKDLFSGNVRDRDALPFPATSIKSGRKLENVITLLTIQCLLLIYSSSYPPTISAQIVSLYYGDRVLV